ncbi:MAG: heterodisulfide reductase subunit A2 [Desulfobacteraceae bacterium Eth-SRB2]|nr:MAG: heterodisulfide reductase subunit A2 [Desulfobacteraceae bacterium Eth-SRB2]
MKKKIGKALVVGAGISGIRAALDLAEFGYGVTLIDRLPNIGGILSQLDYQFPTDHCGMCKMLPLVDRDLSSQYCLRKGLFHENIEIRLSTELASVKGEPGHFQIILRQKNNLVDSTRCIGCGECVKVCPVEIPDSFNADLSVQKAIYLPVPHAIPNSYIIDTMACTKCGECEVICPTGAIKIIEEVYKDFRILVVDDEFIVRDSLKEWLQDDGFTVDTVASGPEALDLLSKQAYQLMLTDIKMPGMNGVELLQKAKEDFPDLCVVMMTAYATVETAVEAMKIGALDYFLKPFDPDTLIPMVIRIYQDLEAAKEPPMEVGAIVFCGGTAYFDPAGSQNTFGYGVYPNVVTSLEFERILSGTGPTQGRLIRLSDGKPVQRVAWLQCVGSRDIQIDADFCSSVCCMYAIKEALLAKEKAETDLETVIFYMDMRTFGKPFQRYRDRAEKERGVRFERGRIHTVVLDETSDDLIISHIDYSGACREEVFDMVVLSIGQKPASGTTALSEMVGIPLNQWGFPQAQPFSLTLTDQEGILLGGSFSGLKDINESVIQASAAALSASRVIHTAGGGLNSDHIPDEPLLEISQAPPKIMVAVCTCGDLLPKLLDTKQLARRLETDPAVDLVVFLEQTCTVAGWENLVELVEKHKPNRILIGACLPYIYARKIKELGRRAGLNPALIDVVDIVHLAQGSRFKAETPSTDEISDINKELLATLGMGLGRLKWVNPAPVISVQIIQKALIVGGGIAGMTSALGIADHGFQVDLIEQEEVLGGNLNWLQRTIEGNSTKTLLKETILKVERHPLIQVHTCSSVVGSYGQVGRFYTTIEHKEKDALTVEHGVTILATGGTEAVTTSYGYGTDKAIVTQKELEQKLGDKTLKPNILGSVVMIQCVDSREEPRNYCSRICCAGALKHALYLKEQNPEIAVYILYRDIMTHGFTETYYTQARKAGVIFIPYDVAEKPRVTVTDGSVQVIALEPIIGQKILIDADLVVLATGIVPALSKDLTEAFGITMDQDGFFEEAEYKWRPVDSLKDGVFSCGLTHSPRNITESIATAEAASQRALRILSYEQMPAGRVVAEIRHSLCSLCEQCIDACPYGARILDLDLEKVLVNAAMCQGCGSCAAVCPNSAAVLVGFSDRQMLDVIDFALE